jgi:putative transposase
VTAFSVVEACELVDLPRRAWYRAQAADEPREPSEKARPTPPRGLNEAQQQAVLDHLHDPRFVDLPPREVFATLLDEGLYLCSWRTMYRILHHHGEVRERRVQRHHRRHAIPRLVARRPNEVWSWDITLLRGEAPREFFYLYVILDLFSRYAVGWMVAPCESDDLAERFIAQTCQRQGIGRAQMTLHADRGSVMRSQLVSELLSKLGVDQSHSRPRVSNDNPYSESQFKSLKYHGTFPGRFESLEAARAHCREWFAWYNQAHHHVNLALFTPAQVHFGQVETVRATRQAALDAAYQVHPERFVKGAPQASRPPAEVWINQPAETTPPVTTAASLLDAVWSLRA